PEQGRIARETELRPLEVEAHLLSRSEHPSAVRREVGQGFWAGSVHQKRPYASATPAGKVRGERCCGLGAIPPRCPPHASAGTTPLLVGGCPRGFPHVEPRSHPAFPRRPRRFSEAGEGGLPHPVLHHRHPGIPLCWRVPLVR